MSEDSTPELENELDDGRDEGDTKVVLGNVSDMACACEAVDACDAMSGWWWCGGWVVRIGIVWSLELGTKFEEVDTNQIKRLGGTHATHQWVYGMVVNRSFSYWPCLSLLACPSEMRSRFVLRMRSSPLVRRGMHAPNQVTCNRVLSPILLSSLVIPVCCVVVSIFSFAFFPFFLFSLLLFFSL